MEELGMGGAFPLTEADRFTAFAQNDFLMPSTARLCQQEVLNEK